jgi:hypothetical protein
LVSTDASGNVGIGTSSPDVNLDVTKTSDGIAARFQRSSGGGIVDIETYNGIGGIGTSDNIPFRLNTNNTERMRIDSSGNVLVGKTSESGSTAGHFFSPTGYQRSTRNGGIQILNRISTDGSIIDFQRDGSAVGSINISNSSTVVSLTGTSSGGGIAMGKSAANVYPARPAGVIDNTLDFGSISYRWDDIYATNGTIQTSDRNEKQDIEALSDAEQRVAVACKGLIRKFRWIDSVAEKGDDARIHFGIIAQDLQDAFAAEGLDAGRYAMFISSTWWETDRVVPAVEAVEGAEATYDDEGNQLTEAVEAVVGVSEHTVTDHYDTLEEAPEGATERTRLGVRYPELLAFIIGAL